MIEMLLSGLIGGILGALFVGIISWKISKKERKQNYYLGLINLISNHNWKLKENNLNPGLKITSVPIDISIICYQHLNLLFYAWLNKSIIEMDGSIKGWKNWVDEIFSGAISTGNNQYKECYKSILTNKDLYPDDFIEWLNSEMKFSVKALEDGKQK